MKQLFILIILMGSSIFLSACGGGGSNSSGGDDGSFTGFWLNQEFDDEDGSVSEFLLSIDGDGRVDYFECRSSGFVLGDIFFTIENVNQLLLNGEEQDFGTSTLARNGSDLEITFTDSEFGESEITILTRENSISSTCEGDYFEILSASPSTVERNATNEVVFEYSYRANSNKEENSLDVIDLSGVLSDFETVVNDSLVVDGGQYTGTFSLMITTDADTPETIELLPMITRVLVREEFSVSSRASEYDIFELQVEQ